LKGLIHEANFNYSIYYKTFHQFSTYTLIISSGITPGDCKIVYCRTALNNKMKRPIGLYQKTIYPNYIKESKSCFGLAAILYLSVYRLHY